MIRTVFGSNKSGTALIPMFETITMYLNISTRTGNTVITKGDGSSNVSYSPPKIKDFTSDFSYSRTFWSYASVFTGNISILFLKGLKDVYSIYLGEATKSNNNVEKYNIPDIETFFAQFPNLYSVRISEYAYQTPARMSIIKGDLAKLPNSVERVLVEAAEILNASTDFVLNFSSYTNASKLKFFKFLGVYSISAPTQMKVIGDVGKLPTSCEYLYLTKASSGSAITYTAGKIWASSFDTLYLPISLTPTENDNVLIDAYNSITTAVGSKIFNLLFLRTSLSDVAVAGLIAKGFTVNCTRISDTMLTMPLSSNLLDSSTYANHATMVGTETHSLGGLQTSTGNYAYIPNKTSLDFGTGSLRFGCTVKINAITGTKGIIGKTYFGSIKGRYGITIDGGLIYGLSQMTAGTVINTTNASTYNDGNFHTIEVICDRTTGKQTLTIDGFLINTASFTPSSDNLALNQKFHIGAFGNTSGGIVASSELNGIIKDVFVNKF